MRKIGFYVPDSGKFMYFLTNNFQLDAHTITYIYRERRKIELFFKEIKQTLKIKHFFGDSENAVRSQIFTALTLYLLMAWQKFLSKTGRSILRIARMIKVNLLENKNLAELLSPSKPKNKIAYNSSLLDLCAQPDGSVQNLLVL